MSSREHLHVLIDELPETELSPASRFLEFLRSRHSDPVLFAHETAPLDDEPVTEEDLRAGEEALKELAQGETFSHEQIRRRYLGAS